MRIALGSDHHGVDLKSSLAEHLAACGHEPVDLGPEDSGAVDYPDYAAEVAGMVSRGEVERGILICGSGVGMAIAANKLPGVRAVNAHDFREATMSRLHNNANVLALGASRIDSQKAAAIVDAFLETEFEGGRHERRVEAISALEKGNRTA